MPVVASLLDAESSLRQIDPAPTKRQDFADAQSCHRCQQDNSAHRFFRSRDQETNRLRVEKSMRALVRTFRHFHAAHRIVREIVPTYRRTHDFAHHVAEVIRRLPGVAALQLSDHKLLNVGTLDVAQSAIPETKKQVLSQKIRVTLLRRIFECWKNVRLEPFHHKVPKRHCDFWSALT